MDNRGKNIRKLIEENFSKKEDKDEDEYEEDTLVKRSVNDFLDEKIEEFPNDDDFFNFNVFRRKSFPGDDFLASNTYAGKTISRKSWEKESESDDEYDDQDTSDLSESSEVEKESKKNKRVTFASDYEDLTTKSKKVTFASADEEIPKRSKKVTFTTNDEEIINKTKRAAFPKLPNELEKDDEEISSEDGEDIEDQAEESQGDEDEESSDHEAQDSEDEKESGEEESDIEDDLSEEEVDTSFVYSKEIREESNDLEKGKAIRNQLSLCELLLESRITLQKALFASNQLPKPDNYQNIWAECSEEGKSTMIQCREKVWDLLEKLIHLQCHFRKQCPEFMKTLDETTVKQYEELDETEPTIKRRKLSEYPAILNDLHNHYKPYRNNEIQKWNDRTKAAYGKLAKKDFSAFDLPITKQIDQILADKERLIHRTHIKRANYKIVGEKDPADEGNEEKSEQNSNLDYDEEIYDDDDFYHKLLRDYIERKTADVSDPTQLGRKWIQLQSLRSKMKRKIDTRRTKGRKIKFDVHTKLVNFMAPIINHNSYTDTAVNELYNSIFGKGLINS